MKRGEQMLRPENYLKVIEKLNEEILESDKLFENEGICFTYGSSGYVDWICFLEHTLFNSEMDEVYSEEHLENFIRGQMNILVTALNKWNNYASN